MVEPHTGFKGGSRLKNHSVYSDQRGKSFHTPFLPGTMFDDTAYGIKSPCINTNFLT